ncbi:MAG TPA: LysR family transcriptional regulator, partial [Dissulfurispiraceae bacterium]|nr:LysR family transcriptional regulator [Dissulfurispiraceae bacterium]
MGLACEKLKVFCAVAETKSFSRASEIINLTQPAVSIQIQAFEVEYGTKLFDRTGDITLTAAGEILYRRAKELLSLYAMAEKEISAITGIVKGRIKIGATTTFGNHILPGIIAGFKHTCPRTDITVFVENTRTIIELLHSGAVDFAIVGEVPQSRELMVDLLMSDELVPVVHPAHPSAGKKSVSILEIVDGPIVFREKGSATRRVVEDFLRDNGIDLCDLNISAIMSCTSSIKEAVEKRMGMSFVSEYAVMEEIKSGSLKTVALKEGKIIRNFSLAIPRKAILSHASDMFIRYLKSCSCR